MVFMEIISNLSKVKDERTFIYLILIITVGLSIRFYYLPFYIPIITDWFFNFVTYYNNNLLITESETAMEFGFTGFCFVFASL